MQLRREHGALLIEVMFVSLLLTITMGIYLKTVRSIESLSKSLTEKYELVTTEERIEEKLTELLDDERTNSLKSRTWEVPINGTSYQLSATCKPLASDTHYQFFNCRYRITKNDKTGMDAPAGKSTQILIPILGPIE